MLRRDVLYPAEHRALSTVSTVTGDETYRTVPELSTNPRLKMKQIVLLFGH